MNAVGRIGSFQRVMAHVLWPLGVDALFSFSGNMSYLEENLPYVDRAMGYLKSLSAEEVSIFCMLSSNFPWFMGVYIKNAFN